MQSNIVGLTRNFFRVILFCNKLANHIWLSEGISVKIPQNNKKEDIVAWPIY